MHHQRVIIQHTRNTRTALALSVGHNMCQPVLLRPCLVQHAIERLGGKVTCACNLQHGAGLQVGGDRHRIPAGVYRAIDIGRRPCDAGRRKFGARGSQQTGYLCRIAIQILCQRLDRPLHMQHILRRIVVHVAQLADVVIRPGYFEFIAAQHLCRLGERPREVVAVVIKRHIGILRAVKAALLPIAQPAIHPRHRLAHHRAEDRVRKTLPCVHVVRQQAGIVIEHLFEVRHHPALVHRVAMETAAHMVVDAALGHLRERHQGHLTRLRIAFARRRIQQQVQRRRMRKLRLHAKTAMMRIELRDRGVHQLVGDRLAQRSAPPRECLTMLDGRQD